MKLLLASLCLFAVMPLLGAEEDARVMKPFQDSRNVSVVFESFSLPQAQATVILRKSPTDSELYAICIERVGSKQAKQENLTVIRLDAGSVATTEAVLEYIHPTEYEPPELMINVGQGFGAPDPNQQVAPATAPTPTSFDTRNLGITFEVQSRELFETGQITLGCMPDWTRHVGTTNHGKGIKKVGMPESERQSINFIGTMSPGKPKLIGTLNRSAEKDDEKPRVCFAFVTSRIVDP